MIRNVPTGAQFTFRKRMGAAGAAGAALGLSSLASAGISAGVGLAATAVSDWLQHNQANNMGKSGATAVANALASQLTALRNAYLAEVNPTCADQRAALDTFDAAMIWFQSPAGCGNPQFGSAGDRCISERVSAGAKYSYVDAIRTPIASDPRLASAGCDTGQAVYLPSLNTGTYQSTGITSTGGSSTTGQTAAQIAAGAVAATSSPAAVDVISQATSSPLFLIAAAAIGAYALAKAL